MRNYNKTIVIGKKQYSISINSYNKYSKWFGYRKSYRLLTLWVFRHNICIQWNKMSIDWDSVVIDGVDSSDWPKFCDAYISYAEFTDGTELTDNQLDELTEDSYDYINSQATEGIVSHDFDVAKSIRQYGH